MVHAEASARQVSISVLMIVCGFSASISEDIAVKWMYALSIQSNASTLASKSLLQFDPREQNQTR